MTEPFKMLCSYAYFRPTDMEAFVGRMSDQRGVMIFGDSGAHSARTLGLHLTLDDYAKWCERWDKLLTVYSNLDVIGAPEATYRNQKDLERRGLMPIPVFHTGEPWEWLERYLDEGYTYIALGALLGNPAKIVLPWLAKAFRIAGDRAVFHGFGMTVWAALRDFPFYSVDSSSWGSGFRFGSIRLFDNGRWTILKMRDRSAVLRNRELIRAHGADPVALTSKATYSRAVPAGLAAVAYRRAELYLRKRHGPISVPDSPKNPLLRHVEGGTEGLHLYLANTSPTNLRRGAEGLNLYLADTSDIHLVNGAKGLHLYLADTDMSNLVSGGDGLHGWDGGLATAAKEAP